MDDPQPTASRTGLPASTPIPAVSIGVPVYNGELHMRAALEALLAQTFTDFELIISDNASTDNTELICREYAARDTRIYYFRHEKNQGASANFQFVLDQAGGEFFMWAACDDVRSKSVKVCARSASRAARMCSSPLYTGTPMLTAGIGLLAGNPVRLAVVCGSSIQCVASKRFNWSRKNASDTRTA